MVIRKAQFSKTMLMARLASGILLIHLAGHCCDYTRSTQSAMPIPPPTQSAATPFLAPRFFIAYKRVTRILAPDAPMG